eukprot:tig00000939_g5480.t1
MDDAKMPRPLGYDREAAHHIADRFRAARSNAHESASPAASTLQVAARDGLEVDKDPEEAGGESVQPELWLDALTEDEVLALVSLLPEDASERLVAEDIAFVVPPLEAASLPGESQAMGAVQKLLDRLGPGYSFAELYDFRFSSCVLRR